MRFASLATLAVLSASASADPAAPGIDDRDDRAAITKALLAARKVRFEPERARLTTASKAALDTALVAILRNPRTKITITVHLDRSGDGTLARKRADVVSWYLTDHGVAVSQLETLIAGAPRGRAPSLVLAVAGTSPGPVKTKVAPREPNKVANTARGRTSSGDELARPDPTDPETIPPLTKMRARTEGTTRVPISIPEDKPAVSMLTASVVLDRIIRVYMAGLQRCLRLGLADDPTVSGRVVMNLHIDETGNVFDPEASGVSPQIDACISKLQLHWRFPIPTNADGAPTTASFKISLVLSP
jgi:hypothetical protein